jgi:GAF domain-containing protein
MQRRGESGQQAKRRPKARKAPTAHGSTDHSTEQFDRLKRERDEALEQQAATAEVLKVISRSPGELEPVFNAILENATRICEAQIAEIILAENNAVRIAAGYGDAQRLPVDEMVPLDRSTVMGRSICDQKTIHVADLQNAGDEFASGREFAKKFGHRTILCVPLIREGRALGTILVRRMEVRPFEQKHIALLKTFADQAAIAIESVRLFKAEQQRTRELSESLEQQTATSEVLRVISSSVGELEPVFQTLLGNATRLCMADFGFMFQHKDGFFQLMAQRGADPAYVEYMQREPLRPGPETLLGRIAKSIGPVQIADLASSQAYLDRDPLAVVAVERGGVRTLFGVPMLREGELIGAIALYRQEVSPFTEKQIDLLTNFAAQAVIAIENTRLLNELRQRTDDLSEALERQTATAGVLRVISSSPGNLEPVFNTILGNATQICQARFGTLNLCEGDALRRVALHNPPPGYAMRRGEVFHPHPAGGMGYVIRTKQIAHIDDIRTGKAYLEGDRAVTGLADLAGARTVLIVPMLKEDQLVGAITLYRQEVLPFTDKQIELVRNFASQAVIAIENTRLLNELRESLQQQTATADVLKVISRSTFDLQVVLDTLVESVARLCEAYDTVILLRQDEQLQVKAHHGPIPVGVSGLPIERGWVSGRAFLDRAPVHIHDVQASTHDFPDTTQTALRVGARTILAVPLLRENEAIGALTIRRSEVKPFTDKQIELVTTFADQAVIAIENSRLLNELRESLQQQTATSEVLKVISSTPGELEPVFNAMLANATRICEAKFGNLWLREANNFRIGATHGAPPAYAEARQSEPVLYFSPGNPLSCMIATKQVQHITDMRMEQSYIEREPGPVVLVEAAGARTVLLVPMLKENELIGVVAIYRQEVRPFTEKQIDLITNFAAQAVIAIENTRLLGELRESLQQQTATADVLKVISRSTFDLGTVLQTLVESAARLCDADKANITRQKDGVFFRAEAYGFSPEFMDYVRNIPIQPDRGSAFGRALLERRAVHISDVKADPEYTLVEGQKLGDYRTTLAVPMLREGMVIGVFSLTRSEVRPFSEKQIELATTFADQAAIAIENVRLFESVEQRTRELTKSLEELRTTQDRLVQTQKLASLGQLTAGIAHEIKNPLNFVNNFSGVSAELIDELQDALKGLTIDQKARAEITELADTLRDNLDKVVQHGKRADAIVKNMLLHSREGSGEHRLVDINTLVEESLNLAYHGARAEKQGFNITMQRSLDPAAGQADVFPQDITRVLLNLISNGFYAAIKREAEADGDRYEPTVVASTRSLGDCVEVRIRDNGTGILPDVKEKMFNPFFTTKPAGEGTGLGLSICHDIIVKQHGGSIEVDTQPGEFTEIRIIVPRTAVFV